MEPKACAVRRLRRKSYLRWDLKIGSVFGTDPILDEISLLWTATCDIPEGIGSVLHGGGITPAVGSPTPLRTPCRGSAGGFALHLVVTGLAQEDTHF